jgi:hypothetical protein
LQSDFAKSIDLKTSLLRMDSGNEISFAAATMDRDELRSLLGMQTEEGQGDRD